MMFIFHSWFIWSVDKVVWKHDVYMIVFVFVTISLIYKESISSRIPKKLY